LQQGGKSENSGGEEKLYSDGRKEKKHQSLPGREKQTRRCRGDREGVKRRVRPLSLVPAEKRKEPSFFQALLRRKKGRSARSFRQEKKKGREISLPYNGPGEGRGEGKKKH